MITVGKHHTDDRVPPLTNTYRRGAGCLFVAQSLNPAYPSRPLTPLEPMPPNPTLADFFAFRFAPGIVNHVLQSATRAMKQGCPEETVLACLLHDIGMNIMMVNHGWWSAQLVEPYVSEKVSWAIRYHQALRFYPDSSVGYEYPEMYRRIFGEHYVPPPYIEAAYMHARSHPWYMEARLITLHDDYSFDPTAKVSIEPFTDIIGRHFKQPKEGLGYDTSPAAHMWRSVIYADDPL